MKKRLLAILAVIVLNLIAAVPVLADTWGYYLEITVTDTGGSYRVNVPALLDIDGALFYTEGYMDIDGMDVRMREVDTDRDYTMDSVEVALLIPELYGNQSREYRLYLDYSPSNTAFSIIPGWGGYIAIPDDASIELGNNFEIEQDGIIHYLSTASPEDRNLISKENAFRTMWSGGGTDLVSGIGENYTVPTGFNDPDTAWANEATAYDNNTATGADLTTAAAATSWSSYLELTIGATEAYGIRYYAEYDAASWTQIDVDAYYGGAWNNVYEGSYADLTYEEQEFGGLYSVTQARVRFYNTAGTPQTETDLIREFDFLTFDVSVTASAISAGEHTVKTTADGTNLKIYIDDVEEDSIALGGASVPNNANDYTIMSGYTIPKLDFMTIDVGGVEQLYYQPNTSIIGTTVVDRTGSNNGTITWGANSNLTITIGSIISYESTTSDAGTVPPDMVYGADQPGGWFGTGTGVGLPFYDTFAEKSTEMGMPSQSLYVIMMLGVASAIGLGVLVFTGSSALAAAICGLAIAAGVNTGVLSTWMILVYAIFAIGILYLARQT